MQPPSPSAERPAIAVDDLHVRRGGHQVLRGVTLEVAWGSITGLLGPSGCGKTTAIRSIVGLQRFQLGTVTVLGEPAGSKALRGQIGYVSQAPSLYPDLSVNETLRYFARIVGVSASRIAEVLAVVELGCGREQTVKELSSGEKAQVSLAIALLNEPRLLIMDEPTVGLDPVLRADLWQTFRRLAGGGVSLFVTSHVMDEASECDRLLLMREGRLLAQSTPADLLRQTSQHDLGSAFVKMIEASES